MYERRAAIFLHWTILLNQTMTFKNVLLTPCNSERILFVYVLRKLHLLLSPLLPRPIPPKNHVGSRASTDPPRFWSVCIPILEVQTRSLEYICRFGFFSFDRYITSGLRLAVTKTACLSTKRSGYHKPQAASYASIKFRETPTTDVLQLPWTKSGVRSPGDLSMPKRHRSNYGVSVNAKLRKDCSFKLRIKLAKSHCISFKTTVPAISRTITQSQ
jgi:hypothetical protein